MILAGCLRRQPMKISTNELSEQPENIKSVTIQKINTGTAILRRYVVEYSSGVCQTYGIPPETVLKFIKENRHDFQKVKYKFLTGM
jgi:hypothetical protein